MYEPYSDDYGVITTPTPTEGITGYRLPASAQSFTPSGPTGGTISNVQTQAYNDPTLTRPKPVGIAQFAGSQRQAAPPPQPQNGFRPSHVILHDYGQLPKNQGEGMFNPYNALVMPDGSVRYRNPSNPYGEKAPHAAGMNPYSVGLSYGGPVGGRPTPEGLAALKAEYAKIQQQYPGITPEGHGEAYQRTKGTDLQASRDGRDLIEASWRSHLNDGSPAPQQLANLTQQPRSEPRPASQATLGQEPALENLSNRSGGLPSDSAPDTGENRPYSAAVAQAKPPEENPLYADQKNGQFNQRQQSKPDEKKDDTFRFTPIPMLPQRQYAAPRLSSPDLTGFAAVPRNPLYG